jgi:hypothetical protein
MNINNEKEALAYIEKIVRLVIPKVNRQTENLLRFGIIKSINPSSLTASVEIVGSGQSITNAIYPSSFNLVLGQRVLIGTPDPKIGSQNYILSER